MVDEEYEKEKAVEMLKLVEEHESTPDNKEISNKIHQLADELYYKKQNILSQPMIDVALALHSFTQAAASGGPTQPLDEFIPDLKEIIGG